MERLAPSRADVAAAVGLAVGGTLGLAGTFVGDASTRQLLWTFDGVGLVVAAALLAVKFARGAETLVAGGFLVFLSGESLLLSGNAAGLQGSVPSYCGGVSLWAASLVMVSLPAVFPVWARLTAAVAAVVFAVSAGLIAWGEQLLPTTAPLPALGYPFLVLTFVGWIWRLLRPTAARTRPSPPTAS
jgi:hypothetical protein